MTPSLPLGASPEPLVLQHSPIITLGYVMQVLISLGIVLALIYLVAKYVLPKMKVNAPGRLIQVLDRVFIEPQVSACILKVGKKAWLVVTSSKQVEKISEIELDHV
jgi:flagellar biogenesis protein FliO